MPKISVKLNSSINNIKSLEVSSKQKSIISRIKTKQKITLKLNLQILLLQIHLTNLQFENRFLKLMMWRKRLILSWMSKAKIKAKELKLFKIHPKNSLKHLKEKYSALLKKMFRLSTAVKMLKHSNCKKLTTSILQRIMRRRIRTLLWITMTGKSDSKMQVGFHHQIILRWRNDLKNQLIRARKDSQRIGKLKGLQNWMNNKWTKFHK